MLSLKEADVEIVDVCDARLEEKEEVEKRPRRAFELPPPCALAVARSAAEDAAAVGVRLKSVAELTAEYNRLSEECDRRGPLALLNRRLSGYRLSVAVLFGTTLAAAVVSAVSYNIACKDDSRALRVVGAVVHNFGLIVTQVLLLLYIVFCSYPSVARSRRALAVCAAMVAPLVVFYTAEWAMFEDKQSYFDGTRTPGQRWVMLVWDGPGAWLAFLGIWQFARWHWNGVLRAAGHSPRKAKLTQGLVVHVLTYFLHAVLAAGVVLAAWQVVSFMVGRALVLVVIVPAIGVLIYSATRKHEDTWDGGFAVILATAQFSVIALANLLPFVMTIGGTEGVVWAAVKFFTFYIVYGALFSCFQIAVSRMTQSFCAPQFLYILQVFLDAFVGLAFVELRTPAQFWCVPFFLPPHRCALTRQTSRTLLVLQSTWGLVRNTGLFAACFLYTKDAIARMRTGVAPKHTAEFLLQWDQFYFLANAQSILSDIMSSILVPILFVIDYNLPFGACSVSCVFTRSTLVHFVDRFAILLAFRLVMSLVVVASYCVRYSVMVHGRSGGMSLSSILATAKSLCVAFHLHVWRNIALLVAATIYLYSYMLYPVISFHGFGDASSTSASSSP